MAQAQPREGPLSRVSGAVYWYLVVGVLLILTTLPGTLPLMVLDRSAGNIPLVALCLVPVGPAVAAGLFALRDRTRAEALEPARSFLRGYRLNVGDVLRLWVPALAVEAIIAISLANLEVTGVPAGYRSVLVVIAAMVAVWAGLALVIASLFALRTRDVARLAAYYMARTPLAALGVLALLVVMAGLVYLTFDAVLGLVGPLLVHLLLRTCDRMVQDVEANFVA
ncbi:glycosyltransferase [Georgenia alba]|uniref:Glycosyltransferase n=1 Tax=Georgenia alba TaxID=2233858 RepID=A0ABW2Q3N0_9MICO